MITVKNLSKEDLPTTMPDGSTVVLGAGKSELMDEVNANKFLAVHGEEVIALATLVAPKEKEVAVENKPEKKKK